MTKHSPANNGKNSPKRVMPKGRPFVKGQSGNPAGRPKDGESWAAIIKTVGDMYPDDILALVGSSNDLGREIAQLPKGVQMKYLVTARVFAALMFEPTAGLWNNLMDRAEGKVTQPIEIQDELTEDERIARLTAILDAARTRRDGQSPK